MADKFNMADFLDLQNDFILTLSIRVIHFSDFYQMFQSHKQFSEDFVPKKRHAKFQAGWCP
jgi:hypothetical protein